MGRKALPRHERTGERGATLVEFAVVAPLLFLLLFGVIEFSRLIVGFTGVWTAAREGARHALVVENAQYADCAGILAAVAAKTPAVDIDTSATGGDIAVEYFLPGTALDADPDFDCDPTTVDTVNTPATKFLDPVAGAIDSGTRVRISVAGQFTTVVPLLSSFLDGITLDSSQVRSIYLGLLPATTTSSSTTTTAP